MIRSLAVFCMFVILLNATEAAPITTTLDQHTWETKFSPSTYCFNKRSHHCHASLSAYILCNNNFFNHYGGATKPKKEVVAATKEKTKEISAEKNKPPLNKGDNVGDKTLPKGACLPPPVTPGKNIKEKQLSFKTIEINFVGLKETLNAAAPTQSKDQKAAVI
uniref:Secreted protein n=1 Tax=Rhabditophanes sp. KR3021 TaxID=114890 RepID=A0AC35TN52_9BILA